MNEWTAETLEESADWRGTKPVIDKYSGVIQGVKILGPQSRNDSGKRSYPPDCMAKAAKLYEGVRVNLNHDRSNGPRDYRDRLGRIKNVQIREDGLYADFVYNARHPIVEQFLYDVEHSPENVGFSHVVEAKTSRKNGGVVVEEITRVKSVDLVADPATTHGLFEDEEITDPVQKELCESGLSAVDNLRTILVSKDGVDQKTTRLLESLAVWQRELSGGNSHKETSAMEWTELTEETLKANRQDLYAKITGTDENSKLAAEVKTLKEQVEARDAMLKEHADKLAAAEAEKAKAEKTAKIQEELKEAKLDPADKTVVSEAFMSLLDGAADEAARKILIEDRAAVVKPRVPASAPFAAVAPVADGKTEWTKESFVSRLH